MRLSCLFTIIILSIFSCDSPTKKRGNTVSVNDRQQTLRKKFFVYDEIVHYYNPFEESKMVELMQRQSKSEIDSIKLGLILGDIPKEISDTSFIEKLGMTGFRKSNVDKLKFDEIDKIFIEKEVNETLAMSCEYIFRDILIFKKSNKVIGMVKICFGCMANEIKGTKANTDNFGQGGDYARLFKILHKKKE